MSIAQQLQQNLESKAKKKKNVPVEEMDFDELISKFISKDTEMSISNTDMAKNNNNNNAPLKNNRVYEYKKNNDKGKAVEKANAGLKPETKADIASKEANILNYNVYNNFN